MYEEYDDNEIGALDEDEIEGAVDNSKELLNSVLEEYERDKKQAQMWVKNLIYMFQYFVLTHWGREKMITISQVTLSNAFSWMKILEFRFKFQWNLFVMVQLTIFQHWFR